MRRAVVEGGEHALGALRHVARTGDGVGHPPDPLLEGLARGVHDVAIESEAGHDEEGVVRRRAVPERRMHPPDVDDGVLARERPREVERRRAVHRDAEVAREQVAGALWHQPQRHARAAQRRADVAHRSVATGGEDDVAALAQCLLRLAGAGVVEAGLQPQRLGPSGVARDVDAFAAQGAEVVDLRGVDDDRGARTGGRVRHALHCNWNDAHSRGR